MTTLATEAKNHGPTFSSAINTMMTGPGRLNREVIFKSGLLLTLAMSIVGRMVSISAPTAIAALLALLLIMTVVAYVRRVYGVRPSSRSRRIQSLLFQQQLLQSFEAVDRGLNDLIDKSLGNVS